MSQPKIYDLLILGGGLAGLTAGLYAARDGLDALLVEQFFPGGQALNIRRVENFPGFPQGVAGGDLADLVRQQAEQAGCGFHTATAQRLSRQVDGLLTVETDNGPLQSRSLILALGAEPRQLGLAREQELTGRGVSYCATCDGAFFRNKQVAVAGGGDTALTDAITLARYAESVTVVHRRDRFRAQPQLVQQADQTPNIRFLLSQNVTELQGETSLSGLVLRDAQSGAKSQLPCDGLFVAVGVLPRTEFLRGAVDLDQNNSVITDASLRTSLPNVWAAGDCRATDLRQLVTAAADGARAAMAASGAVRPYGN